MSDELIKKRKFSENEEEEDAPQDMQKKLQGNNVTVEELRKQIRASNVLGKYF